MLMLMNAWMMFVLMKCKCQMQCLTLGCYTGGVYARCRHTPQLCPNQRNRPGGSQKSAMRSGGVTPWLVVDLRSPPHGRGWHIFLSGVLLLIPHFNNIFLNFWLFLGWFRHRCQCWRVDFLLLRFLILIFHHDLLLTWLHGLIQRHEVGRSLRC